MTFRVWRRGALVLRVPNVDWERLSLRIPHPGFGLRVGFRDIKIKQVRAFGGCLGIERR